MLIGFWSPLKSYTYVTTNMCTIALSTVFHHKLRVLIGHVEDSSIALEGMLFNENSRKIISEVEADDSFRDLLRIARNGLLHNTQVSHYTLPVLKQGRLDYFNGIGKNGVSNSMEIEGELLIQLLKKAQSDYDVIFVDLGSGCENREINTILSKLDLVVVCVGQNKNSLNELQKELLKYDFLHNISYCIGRYYGKTKYHLKLIRKKWNLSEVVSVPENSCLIDAVNDGTIVEYFARHHLKRGYDKKYPFFKEIATSADVLLKHPNSKIVRSSL